MSEHRRAPPSADKAAITPQPSTEHLGEDTLHCRQFLGNLMDIGNELAALLARQAFSQEDSPAEAQKSVAAYNTLTRSLRRTIMLQQKLGKPKKNPSHRFRARKRIIRDVEDAMQSKIEPDEHETLHAEFLERLDRPDLEEDIAGLPTAEIVTDICRDLGLAALLATAPPPPPKRRNRPQSPTKTLKPTRNGSRASPMRNSTGRLRRTSA